MKYKCIIFDHDDTVVDSTASIHYPSFVEYLKIYRPEMKITLDEYFRKNFDPGFIEMAQQDFNLSDEDLDVEVDFWKDYVQKHIPKAYDGIREIMLRQKANGGYVCVVSHSFKEIILRDYSSNDLPMPDIIYGWEQPPERRKPNIWPVEQIISELNLERSDVLMVDDLKPGYDMAVNAGVDFAAAGWAHDVPEIASFMENNCHNYFKNVKEFGEFLL